MINSLRIGAHLVPVFHTDEIDGEGLCGEYRSGGGDGPRIYMGAAAGKPGSHNYNATLLHEAIHCLSDLYHIRLNEVQVRCLEQGIISMLMDNPAFSESLYNTSKEG